MPADSFLDTNILVCAYDSHDRVKQEKAQAIVLDAMEHETGIVSTQVLSEFFCVVTGRIPTPLSVDEAQGVINELGILRIVEIDLPMINRAIEAHKKYQLTFWDAMIVVAAERAGCAQVFSEDMNSGQRYNGIEVVNPLA